MLKITPFRWQRWTALVIVTWALMDLTVPGLCPTELGPRESKTPLSSGLSTADAARQTVATPLISATTSPTSSDEQPVDDDCWCCSSHVAPVPRFESTELAAVKYVNLPVFENPSTGWRSPLYLPPRS